MFLATVHIMSVQGWIRYLFSLTKMHARSSVCCIHVIRRAGQKCARIFFLIMSLVCGTVMS